MDSENEMDKERHINEPQKIAAAECVHLEKMVLCLVNACVRNPLEDLHAGTRHLRAGILGT